MDGISLLFLAKPFFEELWIALEAFITQSP